MPKVEQQQIGRLIVQLRIAEIHREVIADKAWLQDSSDEENEASTMSNMFLRSVGKAEKRKATIDSKSAVGKKRTGSCDLVFVVCFGFFPIIGSFFLFVW